MNEVPQPASDPYSVGDRIKVYLGKRDHDSEHHGKRGVIAQRSVDDLGRETGRELDSYSYRIKDGDTALEVWFRHSDLVPIDKG